MSGARHNPDPKPAAGRYRTVRSSSSLATRQEESAAAHFQERASALETVTTTETRSGQVLDWIPIESQRPGTIAAPPPSGAAVRAAAPRHPERPTTPARLELEDDTAARGPAGTVPVLRKDFAAVDADTSLRDYLSRRRGRGHRSLRSSEGLMALAESDGGHRYSESAQSTFNMGAEGFFSVNDLYTETAADFSLIQLAVVNDEGGYVQSVEAGIQEMANLYGDWGPHLFVYYTTNGYAAEGDNQGGYNTDVAGWVQYDSAVFPGAGFAEVSTPGGDQHDLFMKFQLADGNWWLTVGDRWVGYYPGGLFPSLGDHATMAGFWGEVFDSDEIDGPTRSTMGSGQWAESQWPWAAFQRNLRVQVDGAGSMDDFNANSVVVNSPSMYDLETHMLSGEGWGSYQYLGGPGAG